MPRDDGRLPMTACYAFVNALTYRMAECLRASKLLKIILFGSYARGDWVEYPVGRYFSNFDLLD